ncbi:MAG: DUF3293 domain-containing protein [Acidimicrobiales bacterium]
MTSSNRATLDRLLPHFLDTIVITWLHGSVTSITGAWADDLPGPDDHAVHVITAANPHGVTAERAEVEAADAHQQAELLHAVDQAATAGHSAIQWWPAVGTSPDGIHSELSVAVSGLDRSEAVELGRRFDQLAIFELTAETQAVVSCIDTADPVEAPRTRWTLSSSDLTHTQIDQWRSAQTRAAALAGVDLPALRACPNCGSPHLARLLYGMPIGPPPPWIALGGCIIGRNQPRWQCTNCGTSA